MKKRLAFCLSCLVYFSLTFCVFFVVSGLLCLGGCLVLDCSFRWQVPAGFALMLNTLNILLSNDIPDLITKFEKKWAVKQNELRKRNETI